MSRAKFSPVILAVVLVMMVSMEARPAAGQMSWFTQTPHDVDLLAGDSVVLHCQLDIRLVIENGEYKVTWSKDGEEIDFANPDHGNFWLTGDHHSAQYYLLISDAVLGDAGAFSCAVYQNIETGSGSFEWTMHAVASAMVNVAARPAPPKCKKFDWDVDSNQTDINYEGDIIDLICVSYLGENSLGFQLELTWNNQVFTHENDALISINDTNIQEWAYRITADYEDNGALFQCRLHSPHYPDYNETCQMVALNIVHEPKLTFVSDRPEVYQGESLTVSCLTVSNPSRVTYQWFIDPVQTGVVFRNAKEIVEIPSVSSSTGFLNITCQVANDHGLTIASRLVPVLSQENQTNPMPTTLNTGSPLTTESSTPVPPTKPVTTKSTKNKVGYYNEGIGTPMIAVLSIVPAVIILILILIFVFIYKTAKLSTKRREDQIRVTYQDGTTVIDRSSRGGHSNLNVMVQPAVNEGATVPTTMEPGAYNMPPPYLRDDLPSVLDTVAVGGLDTVFLCDEKKDMYMDMQGQL